MVAKDTVWQKHVPWSQNINKRRAANLCPPLFWFASKYNPFCILFDISRLQICFAFPFIGGRCSLIFLFFLSLLLQSIFLRIKCSALFVRLIINVPPSAAPTSTIHFLCSVIKWLNSPAGSRSDGDGELCLVMLHHKAMKTICCNHCEISTLHLQGLKSSDDNEEHLIIISIVRRLSYRRCASCVYFLAAMKCNQMNSHDDDSPVGCSAGKA